LRPPLVAATIFSDGPGQPLPLDRDDVDSIVRGVFDANKGPFGFGTRSSQSADSWRAMGTRKTKIDAATAELLRTDPTLRLLAERITYHDTKLREERAARRRGHVQ
jgi:hypothetical protein